MNLKKPKIKIKWSKQRKLNKARRPRSWTTNALIKFRQGVKRGFLYLFGITKESWQGLQWQLKADAIMSKAAEKETPFSGPQKAFIHQALAENIRLDGRDLNEYRDLTITFPSGYGTVDVQLGNTYVWVQIEAEVTEPREESSNEGLFVINLELNEMASPAFREARGGDLEKRFLEILDHVYRRSGALDTESLCIKPGKACWKITANIHVVNHEGNIMDASAIALMTALQHFRRKDSELRDGEPVVYSLNERDPVPLNITKKPLVISYSGFDDNKILINDPTIWEEHAATGEFVAACDVTGRTMLLTTLSGPELEPLASQEQGQDALERVIQLTDEMDEALENDSKRRQQWKMAEVARSNNDRPVDPVSTV